MVPILGLYAHVTIRGKIREQKGIEVCTESGAIGFECQRTEISLGDRSLGVTKLMFEQIAW